jgi:hypothetical protein
MPGTEGRTLSPAICADAELSRRQLLLGTALGLGALALPLRFARAEAAKLPAATIAALEKSPLVYVSPLHRDGRESSCHGEVWFFWDRGSVLISTAAKTWKARALNSGLDRARIWVGDFGPVARAGDRFRSAPSFDASASVETDRAAFERLRATFGKKYPDEWGKWEPRFEKGYQDGSRTLIRYSPITAG